MAHYLFIFLIKNVIYVLQSMGRNYTHQTVHYNWTVLHSSSAVFQQLMRTHTSLHFRSNGQLFTDVCLLRLRRRKQYAQIINIIYLVVIAFSIAVSKAKSKRQPKLKAGSFYFSYNNIYWVDRATFNRFFLDYYIHLKTITDFCL